MKKISCVHCDKEAKWVRSTQFAGDHPHCDEHAKKERDFHTWKDDKWADLFWETIDEYNEYKQRKLEKEKAKRMETLAELTRLSEEMGLYEDEFKDDK